MTVQHRPVESPVVARRLRASIARLERQLLRLSSAAREMCSVSIVRLEEKLREVELRRGSASPR